MFDAVLGRQQQRRRLWVGTAVSAGAHAALVGAALVLPALLPADGGPKRDDPVLVFVPPPPRLGRPDGVASAPAAHKPASRPASQSRRPRSPRRLTVPQQVSTPPESTAEPLVEEEDGLTVGEPQGGSLPLGLPTGVPDGLGLGSRESSIPFGPGMTRPVRLSGEDPRYTREALQAGVEGALVVKCVLTAGGEVEDCRVLKGLPHMEHAVLAALHSQRYAPATFQGQPVTVDYVFNVRLVLPR